MSHPRILFLCDRNAVRSPMAAALAGHGAASAGLMPDDAVDPFAVGCLLENGIDISAHTPHHVTPDTITPDTVVISLTLGAFGEARIWKQDRGFELEFWDLPEVPAHDQPRDMIMDGYRAIREALKAHIRNRFGK
ncbi:MAG: hypothetical protein KGQ41_08035 [Alphaproteobacteria bacterium]|nr:hypothetical protein [Alphaproteobacteria bacterium]